MCLTYLCLTWPRDKERTEGIKKEREREGKKEREREGGRKRAQEKQREREREGGRLKKQKKERRKARETEEGPSQVLFTSSHSLTLKSLSHDNLPPLTNMYTYHYTLLQGFVCLCR